MYRHLIFTYLVGYWYYGSKLISYTVWSEIFWLKGAIAANEYNRIMNWLNILIAAQRGFVTQANSRMQSYISITSSYHDFRSGILTVTLVYNTFLGESNFPNSIG